MNFKKTYHPAKGYTEICKIGECSLHRLSFGIIELDAGDKLPFETGDKETAIVMLSGHCNVRSGEAEWRNIGNRQTVFENRRAECVYLPRDYRCEIEAIDRVKLAVCATPVDRILHRGQLGGLPAAQARHRRYAARVHCRGNLLFPVRAGAGLCGAVRLHGGRQGGRSLSREE